MTAAPSSQQATAVLGIRISMSKSAPTTKAEATAHMKVGLDEIAWWAEGEGNPRGGGGNLKRLVPSLVMALFGLGMLAPAAWANGATTFTQHQHHAVQSFTDVVPCKGRAHITITYNAVFHGTINKNGSWFTGTMTGTFRATTLAAPSVTYTGHFTQWFGDENNRQNEVEHSTFNVHGTGSDGSRVDFHENDHVTVNANGTVTVSFDHVICG